MENKALIVVEKLNPVELFQEGGMGKVLAEIETKAFDCVADVSTEDGRKDIAAVAYKVARSKTLIDDVGKALVADWKKKAKIVDAARKEARDFLDALKDRVRAPLTEWEAIEKTKKAEAEERERQKNLTRVSDMQAVGQVVDIVAMAMLTDTEYEDIYRQAMAEYRSEQERLAKEARQREAQAREQEAEAKRLVEERAELEKLRAEQAERDRVEREKIDAERRVIEAEKEKIEAEKRMEQERRDREEFERNAKIKAEREAKENAEREAREAENRRIAEEKVAEEKRLAEEAENARQLELAPDREKLLLFANKISGLTENDLNVKSTEARDMFHSVIDQIMKIEKNFRAEIERM